ncbi:MAG TPA: AMP-binding protein [Burkholderiaceae bacterium]
MMPGDTMLPLLRNFAPGTALAWTDRAISVQRFIAQARRFAAGLPAGPKVINLCEDRYQFLLAFAAALIAGKHTLTPASRAQEAIARIARDAGACHVLDDTILAAAVADMAEEDLEGDPVVPLIAAGQPAITLYTSGSTGQPSAHCKTWGMLVQGADQLQQAFAVQPGSCIVGTVPPQHMFGLESTIVFPLQWGCTIHHVRPLLPADIEATVNSAPAPVWLMTTPVHLRACAGLALSGVAGSISATMPLDHETVLMAERILGAPLYEIYGCTEAGITATRRLALDAQWQLCPDFRLRMEDSQAWLEGPRVTEALALGDHIVMHTAERFSLHGRAADMIKIGGKRASLAALNAELLSVEGVLDGCFFQRTPDARLCAFFVAPEAQASEVVRALRKRIDTVFLPRPLWKVDAMPRDNNGKLPRLALEELARQLAYSKVAAPQPADRVVEANHPALEGHFPGNPIVPGVLLLSEVVQLASRIRPVQGIRQAKFHMPLLPGQRHTINLAPGKPGSIKFDIAHGGGIVASGLLDCVDEDEET